MIEVVCLGSEELADHLDELATLRLEVFREWPYLYAGNLAEERHYLGTYLRSRDACVVVARRGPELVGAATALPLVQADPAFVAPLATTSFEPERVFYFGESVLKADCRGEGIGRRFMAARERVACEYRARYTAFCAVIRTPDDPRRPVDARELAPWWRRLGFEPTGLVAEFSWREVGGEAEVCNRLRFWVKELS